MTIATFTLKSATTQANAPFSLGHAFRQGDVPAGAPIVALADEFQFVAKSTWPDGSLKFAVLSGRTALTANTPLSVVLMIGATDSGTALTAADLKATGVVASIGCGAFGTATWATTDWDAPFETWVSGPRASTWRYRKPVGSDAHLVAWLEVTLFAGGEVEVLPWIENGYCRVASPTNKSETYTFTLGGTQRCSVVIDLKHHQRTPIINSAALSYWLGADPGVTPTHDKAYLQSTELVPKYSAVVSPSATEAVGLVSTYVPLQAGNLVYDSDAMPSSGYQRPIGLLPQHDVLYLTTDTANTYGSVLRNGFSAGRYSSHFRDEATNKPILFSAFPNLAVADSQGFSSNGGSTTGDVAPVATGGNGPSWDTAHSPLVGYMAYLLTGRKYFAEEVQFAANFDYIGMGDNSSLRVGDTGLLRPVLGAWQTRAAAWAWRTRCCALTVTPDADTTLRAEYVRTLENNVDHYWDRYIGQANNPWGAIRPGEGQLDSVLHEISPWQQNFNIGAMGWSLCMDMPLSSTHRTKLAQFFQWHAKMAVLVLGTADKFWYINPAPYRISISPDTGATLVDYETGTGPWHATEADIYTDTYTPTPPDFSTTEGVIDSEYDVTVWPTAMLGNLQPAIAYAVRHGVSGASEGYARLTAATNWPDVVTNFNLKPVWSVAPASIGASVVTTPGPKMRVGQLLAGKMAVSGFRGMGITPAQVATGFAKPSLLEQHIVGADPTSEFLWVADDVPAGLDLAINEDSSAIATAADGAYNGNKTVYTDGAGSAGTYSFTLGAPTSTITGVSITPTTATGSTDFDATVSGTGSFSTAKTFSKISGGGSIDASTGVFTPPAQTGSIQTIVVRATSTQDPTWHADAVITIAALVVSRAPRFARPESDISAGAWVPSSGSSLFAMLDEATADSSDYISTTSASTAVVSLAPVVDPATSVNQVVRYQAWAPTGGTLTVRLKQGSTVIASWPHSTLPTTPTIFAQSLTGPECDSITDYTLLRLEFVAAP